MKQFGSYIEALKIINAEMLARAGSSHLSYSLEEEFELIGLEKAFQLIRSAMDREVSEFEADMNNLIEAEGNEGRPINKEN